MRGSIKTRTVQNGILLLVAFSFMQFQPNNFDTIATGLNFPEGPAFDKSGNLWLVELKGGNLVKIANAEKDIERFSTGGNPNGLAIDSNGKIWFCDAGQNSVRTFDPKTKVFETKVSHVGSSVLTKPNDLVFDKTGNLVFTCPGESRKDPSGYVCVLTKHNEVKKITDQKYFPNGLAFTTDGKELVIAETYQHRLWKGEWNSETAEWKNARVWCNIGGPDGPGGPDGMAFDAQGNLYVAIYGIGKVKVVNPEGHIIREIDVPGKNPTNCAMDPSGKSGLVVTEAVQGRVHALKNLEK
jgi:gluconolactonase